MGAFRAYRRSLLALSFFCSLAAAQVQVASEDFKIVPGDLVRGEHFGNSLAASGFRFAASSPFVADSVRVYRRNAVEWELDALLPAPEGAQSFGWHLAMDQDLLAVGDPEGQGSGFLSGNVNIYRRDAVAWTWEAKLQSPSTKYWSGASVALDGERLLYGASGVDGLFVNQGATYVYERSAGTWAQVSELMPADPQAGLYFGGSLALHGDTALVGAAGHAQGGAIYIFQRQAMGWQQVQRLDGFGGPFALDEDVLVVGNSSDSQQVPGGGSAHIFERDPNQQWNYVLRLTMPDLGENDQAGWSVDVQGSQVLVGTRYGGATYVYDRTHAWAEVARLVHAADMGSITANGKHTAFTPYFAVVSNWADNEGTFEGGAVFVYETPFVALGSSYCHGDGSASACPCGNDAPSGALTGCWHTGQRGGLLYAAGSASVGAADLALRLQDAAPGLFAVLYAAPQDGNGSGTPFGDGLRCIQGPRRSFGPRPVQRPYWEPGFSIGAGFAAGETWFFQALFRDRTGPCGTGWNTSNALALTMVP